MDLSDRLQLTTLLTDNYTCLHGMYRRGEFEGSVGVADEVSPGEGRKFYVLDRQGKTDPATSVTFEAAIDNFYLLTKYVDEQRPDVSQSVGPLMLRIKCLIYEAYDYRGRIPDELENYFMQQTETFFLKSRPKEMEVWAEKVNDNRVYDPQDQRTGVIKYLLIAALLGVNSHIRRHSNYRSALDRLDRIYEYAVMELPRQHKEPRESFGVIALSLYLKGRVLLALGAFAKSRDAFGRSAEAYVNRVRQKERFWRERRIKEEAEFRDKVSVTLRRAALVTAFGDGYLSFINSEITRALESLTLARAALSQNSGRLFLAFVDMRFLACKRASLSSHRAEIEKVVEGLESCHETIKDTLKEHANNTRYYLRCSVELSLALYYKSKFGGQGSDESYKRAMELVEEVIEHVKRDAGGESKNPHLLGDARIYKSYLLRWRFRSHKRTEQQAAHLDELTKAIDEAKRACHIADSGGTALLKSEAYAALGAAYTDMVVFMQKRRHDFLPAFAEAFQALQTALKENAENVRLKAASYLRLTRLCLLNESTKIKAHEYFEQWRRLEGKVEHAYLKDMAIEIEKHLGSYYHYVKPGERLEFNTEQEKLDAFMKDVAMKRFATNLLGTSFGRFLRDEQLMYQFELFLKATTDLTKKQRDRMMKETGLLDKLQKLIRNPLPSSK